MSDISSPRIWIDADACPRDVKELVFRAGERLQLSVMVVANKAMFVPTSPRITMVQVAGGPDVADDHIVREAKKGDLAITADIPLAARLVPRGLIVLNPRGEEYDAEDDHGQEAENLHDLVRKRVPALRAEGSEEGADEGRG